jgi:hypothetical protein
MTAFDDWGKKEIVPASFYKLRHHRRLLRTTVFMAWNEPWRGGAVKAVSARCRTD